MSTPAENELEELLQQAAEKQEESSYDPFASIRQLAAEEEQDNG